MVSAALERGKKHYAWARQKDSTRGWSAWVGGVPFITEVIGHGVRTDGGVAIGPHLCADGKVVWFIVAPSSQRIKTQWGPTTVNTGIEDLANDTYGDPNTGEANLEKIRAIDGPTFSQFPAFKHCADLSFEGCADYFLPNVDELRWVVAAKEIIDAADDSGGNLFSVWKEHYWSSSENGAQAAFIRQPELGAAYSTWYNKGSNYYVVPCRRQIIPVTAERVPGGIKVGPYPDADGKLGYLIVAPASQRTANIKLGLYATDVSELDNITDKSTPDSNTGLYNTSVLVGSSYNSINDNNGSIGSPAANLCANLTFEEQSGYFLPNKDELKFILANKDLIASVDDTTGGDFATMGSDTIWTSSEQSNTQAWIGYADTGVIWYGAKYAARWVIPCRRIITGA